MKAHIGHQIFSDFKDKFSRRVLGKDTVSPWMRSREAQIIEEVIERLKPKRVLEWGAGYSTLYFSAKYPQFSSWTSIEHNLEWSDKIRNLNQNPSLNIKHIQPNSDTFTGVHQDGTYEEFKDYVEASSAYAPLDLIMIDGRSRSACLKKARDIIHERGIVILHDANRKHYHEHMDLFKYTRLFTDYRTEEGGLWVGSLKHPLTPLINYKREQDVWAFYTRYGKWFRL